jgi:hypothetical protein
MWLDEYLKKRAERRKIGTPAEFVLNDCNVCTEYERCSKLYKEQITQVRETTMCNVWFKAVMDNKVPIQRMSQDNNESGSEE